MAKYKWVGYSHDTAYEVGGKEVFNTKQDAYENMRNAVLEKMKWNTEYDEDFYEEDDTIGYKVMFSQEMIVHHSFSGCYVYIIYDADEKTPKWEDVFSDSIVDKLMAYDIIYPAEVETIKSYKRSAKRQIVKLGKETDWYTAVKGRRLYAVNRDSRLFENTSKTDRMVMELYNDTDENEVANALGDRLWNGLEYEYTLYDTQHRLTGFVYYTD